MNLLTGVVLRTGHSQSKPKRKENKMKRFMFGAITLILLQALSFAVFAQEKSLVESVAQGCKTEIEAHCANVTPGEGRVLACLYAHGDKLSGQCEFALYEAAVQLERAVAALTYVANECGDDLDEYCASVSAGEGRLLKCLEENEKQVSDRCRQALADVGLKGKN